MTCSARREAARVDARVLPMVAISVAEMEDRVCPSVAVLVCVVTAVEAPASMAVDEENEGSPWEAKGIQSTTSSGLGAL